MLLHLTFEQTPELSYEFAKYYWRSRKFIRYGLIAGVVLMVILLIQYLTQEDFDQDRLWSFVLPIVMIALIWVWFIPSAMKRQINRAYENNPQGMHRELIFSEENILIKTLKSESTFEYDGILKWGSTETAYFLFITLNQAFIIPKTALQTGDEEKLLQILENHNIPAA